MSSPTDPDCGFDPRSDAFTADPYATYTRLRQRGDVPFSTAINGYLLARFDDVATAARASHMVRDPALVMSAEELQAQQRAANWHDMPNHERFVQFSMLERDGALHERLRRLVLPLLSRRAMARYRQMVREHLTALTDELLARQEFDLVTELAERVPSHVIGRVLGVPAADCPQLRQWAEDVVQFFDVDRSAPRKALAEAATTACYEYLRTLIAARRQTPEDDLLSALVAAQAEGRLDEQELISTSMLVLLGGHGSTIDVIGTGLLALMRHPAEFAQLREQPSLAPSAAQEMFRYESPLPFFHRYSTQPVTFGDRTFPAGTRFGLLYGSANRDDTVFDAADQFRIERTPNRHLAFGSGAHTCLGNQLARLEIEELLGVLMARTRTLECIGAPQFKCGLSERGLASLPVRLRPR